LAKSGKFAILHVGNTRSIVNRRSTDARWLRVTHECPPDFHAGLFDTTPDEDNIAAAILESVLDYAST
ncbi:MAG TPA: hypothetical protein VMP00_01285, partial [Burkholderiales bacterium]|nr:hypothetical protein [Burkholderiales bacterium]